MPTTFQVLFNGTAAEETFYDQMTSLEVEENADLLPTGADGEALQAKLADRLLALDLPKRAGPVLEKLMQAANSGVVKRWLRGAMGRPDIAPPSSRAMASGPVATNTGSGTPGSAPMRSSHSDAPAALVSSSS